MDIIYIYISMKEKKIDIRGWVSPGFHRHCVDGFLDGSHAGKDRTNCLGIRYSSIATDKIYYPLLDSWLELAGNAGFAQLSKQTFR